MHEPTEPTSSEVFTMTSGEKVRIEYDRVYVYKSSNKSKATTIELGWSPDTETFILDISFDEFDDKYQANRKAWKEYWHNQHNHNPY
jgi:hypothetical protein